VVLRCDDVQKWFGATHALRGVSLQVGAGEVVALLGENGAGKSTLVRCIGGEVTPDAGEIQVHGVQLERPTPGHAAKLGVAVVHQELSYFSPTSVAENLLLARLPRRRSPSSPTRSNCMWRRTPRSGPSCAGRSATPGSATTRSSCTATRPSVIWSPTTSTTPGNTLPAWRSISAGRTRWPTCSTRVGDGGPALLPEIFRLD
jgi:ABC-type Fe3+/spermidine/putrescine transport system ATPase subunit